MSFFVSPVFIQKTVRRFNGCEGLTYTCPVLRHAVLIPTGTDKVRNEFGVYSSRFILPTGSDIPVEGVNPLVEVYAMTTRVERNLTNLEELFRHTLGGCYEDLGTKTIISEESCSGT
ncbi:hypothetical protein WG66_012516 [Moniliophthora roreri]|nr:hypothetical protein WG66_012516 [Moniliophthora roreri]